MNVIVQAGGRGSRLRHHTWNKPKCLVSVRGKPLLYHLFDRFPNANFIIIGDYAFDKLQKYLEINKPLVNYKLIKTIEKGTASGIAVGLEMVPQAESLMIVWSDLIIGDLPEFPETKLPIVVTTDSFTCRWSCDAGLRETPGRNGVSGIFFIDRAENFPRPPTSGEFVKWFSANIKDFQTVEAHDLEELGDFSTVELQNDRAGFSRFFNEVKILETTVEKRAIDLSYNHLITNEISWYKSVGDLGFRRIPKIHSVDPFVMSRINGEHAYQMNDLSEREKRSVLADYIDTLISLHDLGIRPAVSDDTKSVYIDKTIQRVEKVSAIIPNFDQKLITINGKKCKNIFTQNLWKEINRELTSNTFSPIHGDPTFSNSLVDKNLKIWFIDPRGYFAKEGSIWGDPLYDFAKVYYSAVGGYDNFNRRKFKLHVDNEVIEILMEKPLFDDIAKEIFQEYFKDNFYKIKILHGLIWLSLSGYVKDDVDSIIASFYLGLYYLEEGLE
jgi:thiamine kinase-like enzyme